jgi:hypothetical protein
MTGSRAAVWRGVVAALAALLAACSRPQRPTAAPASSFAAVIVSGAVLDSMNSIFASANEHWDELEEVNTLTQMLGTGKPTQLEYLGCLTGRPAGDTLWITGWSPARAMKRLQFAVTGSCDGVEGRVGTWHTHPYRAGPGGRPLKERRLSKDDLATFAAGEDLVVIVVWDVDSLDVAARAPGAAVRHPVAVGVR